MPIWLRGKRHPHSQQCQQARLKSGISEVFRLNITLRLAKTDYARLEVGSLKLVYIANPANRTAYRHHQSHYLGFGIWTQQLCHRIRGPIWRTIGSHHGQLEEGDHRWRIHSTASGVIYPTHQWGHCLGSKETYWQDLFEWKLGVQRIGLSCLKIEVNFPSHLLFFLSLPTLEPWKVDFCRPLSLSF